MLLQAIAVTPPAAFVVSATCIALPGASFAQSDLVFLLLTCATVCAKLLGREDAASFCSFEWTFGHGGAAAEPRRPRQPSSWLGKYTLYQI